MNACYLDASQQPENEPVSADTLAALGILHWSMPTTEAAWSAPLEQIRRDRGYVEMDQIHLDPQTPGLAALSETFFTEHRHADEEIRFVLAGGGIFDLRDDADRWLRVQVEAGDLIIVPAGRYHRFKLDDKGTITCKRLFRDTSGWAAEFRTAA